MKKVTRKTISDSDIRNLVIARLRVFSTGKKISIGADREYSKEELIQGVTENNEIGKKIVEIQLKYLKSLKKGILLPDE
ncbi:hypothetical protein A2615_00680 [Candidatus Curtissbacteria bacterium RIFOXYD1_FULL_41_36]|uniref:Uncharacterized protein n=1 Tax=Candidatus Curtissbacteria bacterium RIFOXYA1_FULL_41_14 TaxID=1797737 RepID=A0A1F5HG04_9BACT|nr:MAG: hypothetical protein UU53_C0029G0002 [Candidatus Curtissbacteria bacterium GW2011_GWC2_41_21]OGE03078.1 MAG: hypothetical protein A2196_04135 [Candidatus Curtissbacteria bacterium RIFOXYA1_FULL_41_14]OGE08070.1 MAG: hypothetical protein A2615_00680 [Candidatus Curtissbacteria bacterium RIFOXYD1_FULL_41_36]OGE11452.1 MAG: hypothetical protein A2470_04950 [Candidatus Curtissbacteria bacterium RIFOXYC2_FULL_41_11]OGE13418.1 MAG: hypothetical protein A2305_02865 [Candidatus Curtissbacteria 